MYSKKLYKLTKVGDIKWEKYLSGQMFLKIEAKQSETFEAKQSETKRNEAKNCIFSFVKRSEKEAKWFLFRFVSLRSEKKL